MCQADRSIEWSNFSSLGEKKPRACAPGGGYPPDRVKYTTGEGLTAIASGSASAHPADWHPVGHAPHRSRLDFKEFRIAFGVTDALFCTQMISAESVTAFIHQMFPDAAVTVIDKTGTQDHLIVRVTSDGFVDKNLLDRHRMVYQALAVPMKDGRIHALEISAKTKTEAGQ